MTDHAKKLREAGLEYVGHLGGDCGPESAFTIHTLEGDMEARPGNWIIKGVAGEFYPCKPDIFAATYKEVGNE